MSQAAYIIEGAVTDGTIVLEDTISLDYERGYISVIFFSDEFKTIVVPAAGTLTFKGSETGEQFGTFFNGTVAASVEEYDRPAFAGSIKKISATALGITGNGVLKYRAILNMHTNGR